MWIGEGGIQAPAPKELVGKALGLWKYSVRGKEIPRIEIAALRQMMPDRKVNAKVAFQHKRVLRQVIGEGTLSGELDVIPGKTAGVMVMEVLCGKKDAAHLSTILELSRLMCFTLGGYNLKEMTALALRSDAWLSETRGRNEEDFARRKRVHELLEELVELLATTHEENYKIFQKARTDRAMAPVHKELRKVFLREPTFQEILTEILSLETRVSESWRDLREVQSEEIREMAEIYRRQIPEYEKELAKLERRLEKRNLTEAEEEWGKQTRKELATLRRRSDYLWSRFYESVVSETDSILSARREMETIEGGAS